MPPTFPHNIQYTVLWILLNSFLTSSTGLSPSTVHLSRCIQVAWKEVKAVQTLHLQYITALNQFALCCFHSPLLTASQLISFPAGTKTFQFPAFAILSDSKTKSYSEISGSTVTCTSPEHNGACPILHRSLSRAIHLIVYLICKDHFCAWFSLKCEYDN